MSAFIILMVPGSALQIAVAREVSASLAAGDGRAGAGVRRWVARLAARRRVVVALLAIPLRDAARGHPQRRAGVGRRRGAASRRCCGWSSRSSAARSRASSATGSSRWSIIGEAGTRLAFALLLVGAGLDVTGAFLGTALSLVAIGLVLAAPLAPAPAASADGPPAARPARRRAGAGGSALTLLFVLQEVHVIVVKHEVDGDTAGSYAVAAVAAKAIVWVAVGLGMYLLPETARRSRGGEDARPILLAHARADRGRGRADGADLRGRRRAAARRGVRGRPHGGLRRAPVARPRDGAAGVRLPVRAVPAGHGPSALHRRARRRGRRRGAGAARHRRPT